jgi:hypothetical protein
MCYMRIVVNRNQGLYANVQRGLPPAVEREEGGLGEEGEEGGDTVKRVKRRKSADAANAAAESVAAGCAAMQQDISSLADAFVESPSKRETARQHAEVDAEYKKAQIRAVAAQNLETKSRTIAHLATRSDLTEPQLLSIKQATDKILEKTLTSLDSDGE